MNKEIYAKSAGQLFIWANKTATTTIMLPMKESDFDRAIKMLEKKNDL